MYQLFKRAKTKTHPWENDDKGTFSRTVSFSVVLVALLLMLFQTSTAQKVFISPDPDDTDIKVIEIQHELSRSELRAAQDYQEILSKLEFYIRHHLEYFSEYKNFEGRKYQNSILKTMIKIEKGLYCADVDRLTNDLTLLIKSLRKEERELKKTKDLKKLYKTVRTLRYDLEGITDILNEEIVDQLADHKSALKEIKIYLQKERQFEKRQEDFQIKMYTLQELLQEEIFLFIDNQESLEIKFSDIQMDEILETENLQKELEELINVALELTVNGKSMNITIPKMPKMPRLTHEPKIVIPESHTMVENHDHGADHEYSYQYKSNYDGNTKLSNQYNDSILVKSSRIPIFIKNQLGDIEVKGWDRNKIVATYYYQVVADTQEDAKEFLGSISLEMTSDKTGIHVETNFPSLHDTRRQVATSNMTIYVPKKNIVNVKNSFGNTNISNLRNNITVKAKNSALRVENISGSVSSSSKNGSCYFSQISGTVNITSNRGKVTVENVTSDLDIKNSYAPIIISDCQGDAVIENSGEIAIYNHTGQLYIQSENSKTTVQSLKGDLTLTGSFKPFFISSITGDINIKNKNSVIYLSEINGESTVINESGIINAKGIQGPLDFSNIGGEIYIITDESLQGNSVINSDYGMINIIIPQESNILLQASTEGGSIMNSYKTKIKKNDFLVSTTVALGNKSQRLKVTGTNSTIVIKDKE